MKSTPIQRGSISTGGHVKKARDHGVQIAVNTDAHSIAGLDHLGYGIGIARKGWLRAADIPNALGREAIAAWFQS